MTLPKTITVAELADRDNKTGQAIWAAVERREAWLLLQKLTVTRLTRHPTDGSFYLKTEEGMTSAVMPYTRLKVVAVIS